MPEQMTYQQRQDETVRLLLLALGLKVYAPLPPSQVLPQK